MKILFILGNGFDKAQGLATSYPEFYEEYKKIKPTSGLEAQLMEDIQSDYQTWADLEEGLGKYSAKFADVDVFREVLQILNVRLKDYLKAQVGKINSLGLSAPKLVKNLMYPESELELKQRSEYLDFFVKKNPSSVHIDCVTFNYTNTFETILGDKSSFLGHLDVKNIPVYVDGIMHIHGSLDDMILIGVNDESQIANENFRGNAELCEEFVKPEINRGCENLKNESFAKLIQNADVIVLFGVSIGLTDSVWWQAIGKRLDNPSDVIHVIYYPYDSMKDIINYPFRKLRWSNDYIGFLKDRMGMEASVDDLRKKIYIGINKTFLKLG